MGVLMIFLPIIIYMLIIKWLFDKFYRAISKIKKRVFFILLVTLPFWDHIAGYAYFKYLCFTEGGVKIYKTVTNLQEQKDFWFYEGLNIFNNSYSGEEFDFFAKNKLVKRGICTDLIKKGLCSKGGFKEVYLNYCSDKYNNLSPNHQNYKSSCKNTDEIIKKYNLKNIIKVPKSPYGTYISAFDQSYNHRISDLFRISLSIHKVFNKKNNETLAIDRHYSYGGGWYVNTMSPYEFRGSGCPKEIGIKALKELVIPNPYKQNKTTKGK